MSTTNKLEFDFSKFITGLTICSFMLGVLYPLVYYSFFYFNVFEYVELTEIVTHIIKDGVVLLFPYFLGYYIGFIYKSDNEKKWKTIIITSKKKRIISVIIWIVMIALFGYNLYSYFYDNLSLPLLLVYFMSFLSVYILDTPDVVRQKLLTKMDLELSYFDYIFITVISLTIYVGTVGALLKANGVKYLHSTESTYIVNNKDTIKSTKSYYYIGRTNNYVFYFNESSKGVDVFPEKNIQKVFLRR